MAGEVEIKLAHRDRARADDPEWMRRAVARKADLHPDALQQVRLLRRALDARGKRVVWQLRVRYWLQGEHVEPEAPRQPDPLPTPDPGRERVIVIGAGPAGLFAALELARAGVPVTLLERGKPVQARRHDLARITRGQSIDPDSNYCFGEGGAGTYSDGKLYTRAGKRGDVNEVLRLLVAHGAPPEILVDTRPHIGSNRLPEVIQAIRSTLESAGVDYRFEARVEDLRVDNGHVAGVLCRVKGELQELSADRVIVATGHGARDVLHMLDRHGVSLEAKPFAMGVRAEHPQALVDTLQYGERSRTEKGRVEGLPAAAYSCTATASGRGVYSFCMCPGGWIVPAMTEPGALVLNGMSLSRRDSPFANSGIVVAIEPADLVGDAGRAWGVDQLGLKVPPDLESAGALFGVSVQAALEARAWDAGAGGHRAPAQRLVDFQGRRASSDLPATSYQPGLTPAVLDDVLPPGLGGRLREGLATMARHMPGYLHPEAVLAATESRTSSPVRVPRDPRTLESPNLPGLYPAGEGAGYAGGIVSAAIDGLRVARALLQS